ncbi:Melanopsin [Sorochytrium milnesiophthora]
MSSVVGISPTHNFTSSQYVYSAFVTLFRVVNVLLNGGLLAVIFVNRDKVHGDTNLALTLHLSATEFFFCLPLAAINAVLLFNSGWTWLGAAGCNVDGFLNVAGSLWSVMAILWIALDRYLLIVHSRKQPLWFWAKLAAAGWLFVTVQCLVPFMIRTGYVLEPCGVYCALNWWTRDPVGIIPVIFGLGTLVTGCVALAYMYWAIYTRVHRIQQQFDEVSGRKPNGALGSSAFSASSVSNNTNSITGDDIVNSSQQRFSAYAPLPQAPSAPLSPRLAGPYVGDRSAEDISSGNTTESSLERQVLLKGVTITAAFSICWAPYIVLIALALCGVVVPPWYDEVAGICATSFGIASSILSVVVDNKVSNLLRRSVGR